MGNFDLCLAWQAHKDSQDHELYGQFLTFHVYPKKVLLLDRNAQLAGCLEI